MAEDKDKPKSFTEQISSSFFRGLLIVVPPAITAFVVVWLFELTERLITRYMPMKFPGLGLLLVLVAIWIIGVLSGNYFSKKILKFFESMLTKIPVVKVIYKSVKQVSKAVLQSDTMFKSVVLFPYNQSYVIGFLLLTVPEAVKQRLGDDYVCVYMPWSMNMTAGMNFFVKKSEIIPLNMLPQDALQFILTAGTITAPGGAIPAEFEKLAKADKVSS